MMSNEKKHSSRRNFVKNAIKGTVAATIPISGFPTIVPSSVLGKNAPSNQINVGAIGNGRISRDHDMPGVLKTDHGRIVAVCDLDKKRVHAAKTLVNDYYTKKTGKAYDGVKTYDDYRELLNNKDIDAVLISTPDHWHVIPAINAVRAGKDVYMQKPASL
ncbi:MAG TPA: Gfo/Idh/MocA family oxidoreductase, partial [Flavitalea sp.]|nr:Gfo/Idh/MocA family oxidoreductase [Flavitalea sp.]